MRAGPTAVLGGPVALTVVAGLTGCSQPANSLDPSSFRHMVQIETQEYTAAPRLVLDPVWRVCHRPRRAECPPGDIQAATFGANGTLLLAGQEGPLSVFDTSGAFRGLVGRWGDAPDGYVSATSVRTTPDGRVYLFDQARYRVLTFGPAGELLHRARVPLLPADLWATALWPGGIAILSLPPGSEVGQPVLGRVTLVPVDGGAGTTRFSVPLKTVVAQVGALQPMKPFFQARPVWAVNSDGAVTITTGDTPWIARYSSRGDRDWLIRLPVVPVRVTAAELEAEKKRILEMFTQDWWARTLPIIERTAKQSPRVHPLVTALVALRDGSLWVRESPASGADSVRWDVLSPGGQIQGVAYTGLRDRVADGTSGSVLVVHDTAGPQPFVSGNVVRRSPPMRP